MRNTHFLSRLTLTVAMMLVGMILYSSPSFAQKDPSGKIDTCRIVVSQKEKSNQVMASVSVFNDEELAAMTLAFRFGNGKTPIRCDSVSFRETRTEDFAMKTQYVDTVLQTVLIGLISDMSGSKPPLKKGDGEVARMYFTLPKNQKFQDCFIDTTWIKPFNVLKFVTPDVKGIYPAFENSKALIKGGIPITSSSEKKSEVQSKEGKEAEAEKPPAPDTTEKK
jgi:hypothetical protein